MNQNLLTTLMRGLALVLAGGFMLLACGSDDSSDGDTSSNGDGAVEEAASSSDETESADEAADTSSDDSNDDADASEDFSGGGNLLVPLDYLQGVWCDHEGTTWTIDGEMATLDDGSGGTGQMPLNVLFLNVPGALISQSDNEFVFNSGEDEVTFTRGAC